MSDSGEGSPKPEDYSQKPLDELWAEWKVKYDKKYETPEEEQHRFEIFKDSKKFVEEHNAKYAKGEVSYFCGLNHLSDLKSHEVCCGGRRGGIKKKDESEK